MPKSKYTDFIPGGISPEIEEYFKSRILPLAQKANPGTKITLEEYHDRIERILMARREEVEMQGWLAETRKRTKIDYRDEELKPQPADGVAQ